MMLPGIPTSGAAYPRAVTAADTSVLAADTDTTTAVSFAATVSAAVTAAADVTDVGISSSGEEERGRFDETNRSSGGNRWPRQETLALLKIRSDMDVAFRDSSLKGPLWDEVSRKLAELGYHRSAKKCKEKFENVYKYHKRTKEGRTSKADGKTYRFFDQLEALEGSPAAAAAAGSHHHQHHHSPLPLPPPQPGQAETIAMPNTQFLSAPVSQPNNVDPISVAAPAVAMQLAPQLQLPPGMDMNHVAGFPFSQLNMSASTNSSSSSTSSDEGPVRKRTGRKRKWREFFGRMMKDVIDKQEELQLKFLDTLERRERDRMAREEAWRMQELAKIKREHELLAQERSIVAAKDAAVISFLQKLTEQNPNVVIPQMSAMQLLEEQQQQHQQQKNTAPSSSAPPTPPAAPPNVAPPPMQQSLQQLTPLSTVSVSVPIPVPTPALPTTMVVKNPENYGVMETVLQPSPSRWPKAEIYALINLRTTLDTKYQESGPKGPLWEEISSAMRKLGYNRNAKRCKEKWENINKYYKKVKESSKKRPEDSKTCPYFHQLDAIYREKAGSSTSGNINNNSNSSGFPVKPRHETQMVPIMAQPEQQWPLPAMLQQQPHQQQPHQQQHHQRHQHQHQPQQQHEQVKLNEDKGTQDRENEDDYDDDDDNDDDDGDEEQEGGEYEIVANKTSSMAAVE